MRKLMVVLALAAATAFAPAFADEGDRPQTELRVSLEAPITLAHYGSEPEGFSPSQINAPILARLDARAEWLVLSLRLGFLDYSPVPMVGMRYGLAPKLPGGDLRFGFGLDDQRSVIQGPFDNSQFDTVILPLWASFETQLSSFTVFVEGRYLTVFKRTFASFEGFDTDVDHKGSFALSPELRYALPLGLGVATGVDFYFLGATAIASKEFSFGIPENDSIVRWRAGASWKSGNFEVYGRVNRVFGAKDERELFYQAPFFLDDYLLSPTTLSLGVSWRI